MVLILGLTIVIAIIMWLGKREKKKATMRTVTSNYNRHYAHRRTNNLIEKKIERYFNYEER